LLGRVEVYFCVERGSGGIDAARIVHGRWRSAADIARWERLHAQFGETAREAALHVRDRPVWICESAVDGARPFCRCVAA